MDREQRFNKNVFVDNIDYTIVSTDAIRTTMSRRMSMDTDDDDISLNSQGI